MKPKYKLNTIQMKNTKNILQYVTTSPLHDHIWKTNPGSANLKINLALFPENSGKILDYLDITPHYWTDCLKKHTARSVPHQNNVT